MLDPSNEREIDNSNGQPQRIVICIFFNVLHLLEESKCNVDGVVKMDPHCPGSDPCHPQSLLGAGQLRGVLDGVYRICLFRRW